MISYLTNYKKGRDLVILNIKDAFLNRVLRKTIKKTLKIDLRFLFG
jgi:hypothetical protein